jgi:hypothetical protein
LTAVKHQNTIAELHETVRDQALAIDALTTAAAAHSQLEMSLQTTMCSKRTPAHSRLKYS